MGELGDLPEELFAKEIMSRLPMDSLMKLKHLKKSWYSLVKDLMHKSRGLCLVFEGIRRADDDLDEPEEEFSLKILNNNYSNTTNTLDLLGNQFKPKFPGGLSRKFGKIYLAGNHCDGIICLVNNAQGNIVLLNPLTKQGKCLPRKHTRLTDVDKILRVGFGYDEISRVYKVVKISGRAGNNACGLSACVHTLGDDDGDQTKPVWRDIDLQIDLTEYWFPTEKELYCGGSYYWLVSEFGLEEALHSFDMHSEEFRVVPLPKDDLCLASYFHSYLTEWNECLALLCHLSPEKPIEMWVMNNLSKIWTKHQSITLKIDIPINHSVLNSAIWLIGFLNTHQLLVRLRSEGRYRVVSYDLLTREVSLIYEAPTRSFRFFHFCGTYTPLINI